MTITLPIDTAWFIAIVFFGTIILVVLTAVETDRWYSRHARRALKAGRKAVAQRERAVRQREIDLGRKAHDVATQVNMARYQHSNEDAPTEEIEVVR